MRGMPDKNGEIQDKILDIRQVFLYSIRTRRRIEQLAARRAHNPEVVGSSPTPANRPVRFPVSAFFVFGEILGVLRRLPLLKRRLRQYT